MSVVPPRSEAELLARASACAGRTIAELAHGVGWPVPRDLRRHKGWSGELLEAVLGATAGSNPQPDFVELGIELKTVPLGPDGTPRESTHVCTVAVHDLVGSRWETSTVRRKLARVLWVPVEGSPQIALGARRVGQACLWSPGADEEAVLRADWEEYMELLATGRYDAIDARLGVYLQIRPKAANSRALVAASDAHGVPAATLPRGFYLRPGFTKSILLAARG